MDEKVVGVLFPNSEQIYHYLYMGEDVLPGDRIAVVRPDPKNRLNMMLNQIKYVTAVEVFEGYEEYLTAVDQPVPPHRMIPVMSNMSSDGRRMIRYMEEMNGKTFNSEVG